MRHVVLHGLRRLLQGLDQRLAKLGCAEERTPAGNGREAEIEAFLRELPLEAGARGYLETHRARLVRTLGLVPAEGGRALELGTYGFTAALVGRVLGYREVRGAYYAATPGRERKTVALPGGDEYVLEVDLFDAERHEFPYASGQFDLVLCCELIEHLTCDPMRMLMECQRVLREDGLLLLTTPNAASLSSIASVLLGWHNPQVFSMYPPPGDAASPHVREYTPRELRDAVEAAGFAVEALFTEPIPALAESHAWAGALLEREGFDTALRGEQSYCVARRRAGAPLDRRPAWLYAR